MSGNCNGCSIDINLLCVRGSRPVDNLNDYSFIFYQKSINNKWKTPKFTNKWIKRKYIYELIEFVLDN